MALIAGPLIRVSRLSCPSALILAVLLTACHTKSSEPKQDPTSILAELRQGHFDAVLKAAHTGQEETRAQPVPEFWLLEAEAYLGKGQPDPALIILRAHPSLSPSLELRRKVDLANALRKKGDLTAANKLLDELLVQAGPGSLDPNILEALIVKGATYWSAKNPDAAEDSWHKAAEIAHRARDSYHEGMALSNLASIPFGQGRWDQAKLYYERAQVALQQAGATYLRSVALSNLSVCDAQLGDLDLALSRQSQNIEIQKGGDPSTLAASYGRMGLISDALGAYGKAIFFYSQALDLATKLHDPELSATQAVNLANIYVKQKNWPDASTYNDLAGKSKDSVFVRFNAASIAAGKGDSATATRYFQDLAKSPQALPQLRWGSYQALAKLSTDPKESNGYFEKAIALIADSQKQIQRRDDSIAFLTEPIEVYRDYVQSLIAQDQPDQALLVADSSRALSLQSAVPAVRNGTAFQNTAKAANAVLLFYWLGSKNSYAWVVTPQAITLCPLPQNSEAIREWVTLYSQEIMSGSRPRENPKSVGVSLHQALIAPVQALIPAGSAVIVVPDGAIDSLNLETLPAPGGQYWIRNVTLSVAPSLSLLSAPVARRGGNGLLVLGDAQPAGPFHKLAHAADEIRSIEAHFPQPSPTALTGAEATVAAYHQAKPERFRLIHFATHAETNTESPLESAVILSPAPVGYKLYARDIYDPKTPLQADLVTVSACQSAGAKAYSGEGLIGFAWAFLHAGARHVIAGLWEADDASTAPLMDRLYGGIQAGLTPPEALRAAKMEMLDSPAALNKPHYWGAFQVYRRSVR